MVEKFKKHLIKKGETFKKYKSKETGCIYYRISDEVELHFYDTGSIHAFGEPSPLLDYVNKMIYKVDKIKIPTGSFHSQLEIEDE